MPKLKSAGGAVKRWLHHRSNVYSAQSSESYWAQPRANLSMDGKFMAFTSNWDGELADRAQRCVSGRFAGQAGNLDGGPARNIAASAGRSWAKRLAVLP